MRGGRHGKHCAESLREAVRAIALEWSYGGEMFLSVLPFET